MDEHNTAYSVIGNGQQQRSCGFNAACNTNTRSRVLAMFCQKVHIHSSCTQRVSTYGLSTFTFASALTFTWYLQHSADRRIRFDVTQHIICNVFPFLAYFIRIYWIHIVIMKRNSKNFLDISFCTISSPLLLGLIILRCLEKLKHFIALFKLYDEYNHFWVFSKIWIK